MTSPVGGFVTPGLLKSPLWFWYTSTDPNAPGQTRIACVTARTPHKVIASITPSQIPPTPISVASRLPPQRNAFTYVSQVELFGREVFCLGHGPCTGALSARRTNAVAFYDPLAMKVVANHTLHPKLPPLSGPCAVSPAIGAHQFLVLPLADASILVIPVRKSMCNSWDADHMDVDEWSGRANEDYRKDASPWIFDQLHGRLKTKESRGAITALSVHASPTEPNAVWIFTGAEDGSWTLAVYKDPKNFISKAHANSRAAASPIRHLAFSNNVLVISQIDRPLRMILLDKISQPRELRPPTLNHPVASIKLLPNKHLYVCTTQPAVHVYEIQPRAAVHKFDVAVPGQTIADLRNSTVMDIAPVSDTEIAVLISGRVIVLHVPELKSVYLDIQTMPTFQSLFNTENDTFMALSVMQRASQRHHNSRTPAVAQTLFIDRLLVIAGVSNESLYPPSNPAALKSLVAKIQSCKLDDLKKHALVFYLLKSLPNVETPAKYVKDHQIPPHFVMLMEGYYKMDHGHAEDAADLLVDPLVNMDWPDDVVRSICERGLRGRAVEMAAILSATRPEGEEGAKHALRDALLFSVLLGMDDIFDGYALLGSRLIDAGDNLFERLIVNCFEPTPKRSALNQLVQLPLHPRQEAMIIRYCRNTKTPNLRIRSAFLIGYYILRGWLHDAYAIASAFVAGGRLMIHGGIDIEFTELANGLWKAMRPAMRVTATVSGSVSTQYVESGRPLSASGLLRNVPRGADASAALARALKSHTSVVGGVGVWVHEATTTQELEAAQGAGSVHVVEWVEDWIGQRQNYSIESGEWNDTAESVDAVKNDKQLALVAPAAEEVFGGPLVTIQRVRQSFGAGDNVFGDDGQWEEDEKFETNFRRVSLWSAEAGYSSADPIVPDTGMSVDQGEHSEGISTEYPSLDEIDMSFGDSLPTTSGANGMDAMRRLSMLVGAVYPTLSDNVRRSSIHVNQQATTRTLTVETKITSPSPSVHQHSDNVQGRSYSERIRQLSFMSPPAQDSRRESAKGVSPLVNNLSGYPEASDVHDGTIDQVAMADNVEVVSPVIRAMVSPPMKNLSPFSPRSSDPEAEVSCRVTRSITKTPAHRALEVVDSVDRMSESDDEPRQPRSLRLTPARMNRVAARVATPSTVGSGGRKVDFGMADQKVSEKEEVYEVKSTRRASLRGRGGTARGRGPKTPAAATASSGARGKARGAGMNVVTEENASAKSARGRGGGEPTLSKTKGASRKPDTPTSSVDKSARRTVRARR